MVRYMLPVSVVTNTGGTFVGTGDHNDLNDQNNATYWYTGDNTAETLEVKMTDFSASPPAYGFMSYSTVDTYADGGVVPADAGNVNAVFNVSVYQGTTAIYTSASNEVPTSGAWSTDQYAVNFSFDSITDWSDVRVRIVTSGGGGSPAGRRGVAISRISLEIPNAGTAPSWRVEDYRFYNDDSATWANITPIAAQNTAASVDNFADFILAINFGDVSTSTGWDSTGYPLLQYSVDGGAWTTVTTATNLRIVNSTNYNQADNNGLKLGGLSGTTLGSPGSYFVDTSEATGSYKWDNHSREYHYRLRLVTGFVGGEQITFRMLGTDTDVPSTRPVATMLVTPTLNINAAGTEPTWVAEDYRFYAAESLIEPTPLQAENTGVTLQPDSPFILIGNVGESGDATTNNTGAWGLQYRINGGSWVAVPGPAVTWATTPNAEGDSFGNKLSTIAGVVTQQSGWNEYQSDSDVARTSQTWTDDSAEMAWGLRIRGDAGLVTSDVITFSYVSPQATTIVPTNIPTITVDATIPDSGVVQEKGKKTDSANTVVIASADGLLTPTAGNLLIVVAATTDTGFHASTPVTDNSGAGSWALAVQSENTTDSDMLAIWWKISNGGETSITVQNSLTNTTPLHMVVMEVRGPWNPSPVDTTGTQTVQTVTAATSGTAGTGSQANRLAVAALAARTSQVHFRSWINEYIERYDDSQATGPLSMGVATRVLTGTAQTSTQATMNASVSQWGAIATFKRGNNGTLTRTLDTATASSAGDIEVSGGTTAVEADSTAYTVDTTAITADGAGGTTLGLEPVTLSASGTVAAASGVNGTADITLAAATASSAGTVDIAGSASITTGAATSSSAGTVDIVGSGDITLGAATLSSAGGPVVDGALTRTLADVTISAAGGPEVSGALIRTLDDATVASDGDVEVTGDADVTLAAAAVSSTGTVEVQGSLDVALEAAAVSAAGTVDVTGDADITLAAATVAGAGIVGDAPVEGTANITLAAATLSSAGTVDVAGALDSTLDSVAISATGTAEVSGSATITLADVALSSAGTVDVAGAADITLDSVAISSAGTVVSNDISGTADITLAPATISAAGAVDVVGSLSRTLDAVAASAAGAVDVVGSLSRALEDVAIEATGVLATGSTGTADITLDAATISSVGTVDVTGTGDITLGDATLIGGDPRQVAAGGGGWSKDWLRAFEEWLKPVKVHKRKKKSALARSVEQVLRANFQPEPVKLPPPPPRPPKLAPQVTAVAEVRATIEARATLQVGSCSASGAGSVDWSGEDEDLMLLY